MAGWTVITANVSLAPLPGAAPSSLQGAQPRAESACAQAAGHCAFPHNGAAARFFKGDIRDVFPKSARRLRNHVSRLAFIAQWMSSVADRGPASKQLSSRLFDPILCVTLFDFV